jgi:hypothetical protein
MWEGVEIGQDLFLSLRHRLSQVSRASQRTKILLHWVKEPVGIETDLA